MGLGYYPAAYRDLFPSLRTHFGALGYSAFIPEGTFKVEEARLEALKVLSSSNQKREEARLKSEGELEEYILSRASSEAEFWKNSVVHLELQRQIAVEQLTKAKNTTLEQLIARKALADAERAEHEKEITATALTRKANADAERAEAEVALVKCQHKKVEKEKVKLDWEIQLIQAEKAKFDAEAQLLAAQAAAATAASAIAASAPPQQTEVKQLLTKLEKMDPCSGGYPWVDKPDEGGFRCEGGSHFKTYAEARAFVAQKK